MRLAITTKHRRDDAANYRATFLPSGKTLRFRVNSKLPFGVPATPEIEDVAINDCCLANCPYCYTSATPSGTNFEGIVAKAFDVWGSLPDEQRPFQIAIGGAGESTMHPRWSNFVAAVRSLGILPNYTTNGMHLTDEVLAGTEEYCGGVALSWHPHIAKTFHAAVARLLSIKTRLNFHVIIGDAASLSDLIGLYDRYAAVVDYFVVLPYQSAGRAPKIETATVWKQCFEWVAKVESKKFAFGALFYDFLMRNDVKLDMSMYEPERFSGYRIMDERFRTLFKSSYDLRPKHENLLQIRTRPRH